MLNITHSPLDHVSFATVLQIGENRCVALLSIYNRAEKHTGLWASDPEVKIASSGFYETSPEFKLLSVLPEKEICLIISITIKQ